MEQSNKFTHGSLFSGIGGFDLAAEWMGWENVFHCEWNPFGKKILNYYWPNAISYDDITKTDFTKHRGTIDVLSGGFPCQPYSQAGSRKGKEDERHLWPYMFRAIKEIKPTWIVGENVRGLVNWNGGLVFDEVQADMESEGYNVFPFLLPASSVGAPHQRERIWFIAYSEGMGRRWRRSEEAKSRREDNIWEGLSDDKGFSKGGATSHTYHERLSTIMQPNIHDKKIGEAQKRYVEQYPSYDWGALQTEAWENFPTQPPVCDGDDGISTKLDGITFSNWRIESVKAGGNAIVPQVVHQIFKAIEQYEQLDNQN